MRDNEGGRREGFTKQIKILSFPGVALPGHVDPPWWGSAGAGGSQGEACVVLCWCGCTVWTHLKEPAGGVGRKTGGGSSHPGPGKCAVQVCLVSPTAVSLVGFKEKEEKLIYSLLLLLAAKKKKHAPTQIILYKFVCNMQTFCPVHTLVQSQILQHGQKKKCHVLSCLVFSTLLSHFLINSLTTMFCSYTGNHIYRSSCGHTNSTKFNRRKCDYTPEIIMFWPDHTHFPLVINKPWLHT